MEKKSANQYILAVDHGTSGIKTSLMSIHGKTVANDFISTPIFIRDGGTAEQDPEDWWKALLGTCKNLVDQNLVPREDIL